MAFRILNQFPVYLGDDGRPVELGVLRFFDAGTMIPREVYADPGLATSLGVSVGLGVDGRAVDDVWGDGRYYVRLEQADGTLVAEADNVEIPGGAATAIPAPVDGQFLTNADGVLVWTSISQVPDPTGQSGKQLGTDGTLIFWEPKPAIPDLPVPTGGVTQPTANQITIGDVLIQFGRDTAPPSGTSPTQKAVSFPTAFQSKPFVFVQPTVLATSPGGFLAATGADATASGFTAKFDNNSGFEFTSETMSVPITFDWIAIGPKIPAA